MIARLLISLTLTVTLCAPAFAARCGGDFNTFLGEMAALYGAGLVASLYGNIQPEVFLQRLREVREWRFPGREFAERDDAHLVRPRLATQAAACVQAWSTEITRSPPWQPPASSSSGNVMMSVGVSIREVVRRELLTGLLVATVAAACECAM